MRIYSGDIIAAVIAIIMAPMIAFILFCFFIIMPLSLDTSAKCLKAGYPRSEVTLYLDRYCMNLEGAVTVRVDKLEEE